MDLGRRQFLAGLGTAAAATLAGCSDLGDDETTPEPSGESGISDLLDPGASTVTGTAGRTDAGTETPTDTGTERPTPRQAPDSPPYRVVELENRGEPVEVRVRVVRTATGEQLHEETYALAAGETRLVYNSSADGLGGAGLTVRAETPTDTAELAWKSCTSDLPIVIDSGGGLEPRLAVC